MATWAELLSLESMPRVLNLDIVSMYGLNSLFFLNLGSLFVNRVRGGKLRDDGCSL